MELYVDAPPYRPAVAAGPARTARSTVDEAAPFAATPSQWRTAAVVVATDGLGLLLTLGAALLLQDAYATPAEPFLAAFFGVLVLSYVFAGLYSGAIVHPAEEIRRVCLATAGVSTIFAVALLATEAAFGAVFLMLALGLHVMVVIALLRVFARFAFAARPWWGTPVVVLSRGGGGVPFVRTMSQWPELGLKPVVLVDRGLAEACGSAADIEGVPVCGDVGATLRHAARCRLPYAVLAMRDVEADELLDQIGRHVKVFKRVMVLGHGNGADVVWSTNRFFEGMLGYAVQHPRHKRVERLVKRAVDVIGALVLLLLVAPFWLAIHILIRLDSKGPAIYRQTRMGLGGRPFQVLKFRSMYLDAEQKLDDILAADPVKRREYEVYRKLQDDPRVTPVGRWIRRYSLDELPQLLNILGGDMSLIGPRAYTPGELGPMKGKERIILQGRPGLTGLWQVSGRNRLSFEERVGLDVHYTHNWNVWLDTYILARTIPVVFKGEGAS